MWTAPASVRHIHGSDRLEFAIRQLEDDWHHGRPNIVSAWNDLGDDRSITALSLLIKADLRCRFRKGEQPRILDYLDRFPEIREQSDRMLSLIYEEFCLLEEQGQRPDVADFCEQYAAWKDSIASQLRYHSMLSQLAGRTYPSPKFPKSGDQFEEFTLGEELGRGGSARVFRAIDGDLGEREVVLKIYLDRGREASILGRLDHPHIIPVHSTSYQEESKLRGLCMPYRPGLPIDELIRRVGPASHPESSYTLWTALADCFLPVNVNALTTQPEHPDGSGWLGFPLKGSYFDGVVWIITRMADALDHAHSRGIQHRDVKPANILLTVKDGPQLLDFNLAQDHHSPEQAEAALQGGTLPYMAPEQLEAFLDSEKWNLVDHRADLYSLGLVLRELLIGETPDVPDPTVKPARAIRDLLDRRALPRQSLPRINPRIPQGLDEIADRCLAYDATNRYQSARELARNLRNLGQEVPATKESTPNWPIRHRKMLVGSLVFLVAAVVIGSRLVSSRPPLSEVLLRLQDTEGSGTPSALAELAIAYPRQPEILFCRAAAEARARQLDTAELTLAEAWSIPGARSALALWGKSYPLFVSRAESLVSVLLSRRINEQDRRNAVFETAGLILEVDPNSSKAKLAKAAILESSKEYGEADQILSHLIDEIGENPRPPSREQAYKAYHQRARVLTNWANLILDTVQSDNDLAHADSHLARALRDLDRVDSLLGAKPSPALEAADYIRCRIKYLMAKVAWKQGRTADSIRALKAASALYGKIAPSYRGDEELKSVAKQVEDLLKLQEATNNGSSQVKPSVKD